MDRLFLDADVLFSAAYREDAGLVELWKLDDVELATSAYAFEEARRNLSEDEQLERLQALVRRLSIVPESDVELPSNVKRRCCINPRRVRDHWYDRRMGKTDYTFRYRIRNWPDYNRALVARGSLTFWFDEDAIGSWRHTKRSNRSGRPRVYSDNAIHCALVLSGVFHLSLRSTQGFLASLVELMALELPVPDYSTLSRRQSALDVGVRVGLGNGPRHVVIDSTGLKIYGAGEWHVRKHGRGRRKAWRKLQVSVDETPKEIVAADITPSNAHDSKLFAALLDQIPGEIRQVSGDVTYDTRGCYETALQRGTIVTAASCCYYDLCNNAARSTCQKRKTI